ncbi:MAG: YdeI/OmpD-associated family protein [Burkholderiales bacterium]|nr:YdeI/OmpD-associated family protein [Burkholderiales bacterium]
MKARYFATPADFRAWLSKNHATAPELWVGFHKVHTGMPSITWPQSVDEALCFGWIDGLRKSLGEGAYAIRFSPRRPRSIWSNVNTRRVAELTKLGLMRPAGLAAFKLRDPARAGIYSSEAREAAFEPALEKTFRAHRAAWKFFNAQPPGYRRVATHWVTSAKREETRAKRLKQLIDDSASGLRLALLRR